MIDIQFIRDNPELVKKSASLKGYDIDIQKLLELDARRRSILTEIEELRAARNEIAEKTRNGEVVSDEQKRKGRELKEKVNQLEDDSIKVFDEYDVLLRAVPNVIPDDTPEGGEENNREEKKWGDTPEKSFDVKDHQTWATERGLLDFERGAKVAGNKFYFVQGDLVNLEFAILQAGIKLVQEQGFMPMLVPHLVNSRVIDGAGFTAKSADEKQIYKIEDEDLNLIATAEIPLTGYHADETLTESDLPKLYAGYSPAYRVEAGAYGKHSRGLYRVHQFNKLELYVYCKPQDSEQWHQKLLELEEKFCQLLEIPYRVVRIAAGDLGSPAYKKYDIEYWSPVDKGYRELMSVSNVTDYQARRLNIKYKKADGTNEFVHTLNGTAAAMSRMIIALIENCQQADGSVTIPEALKPYLGKDKI
jgi:seryl-tRNA synthetase